MRIFDYIGNVSEMFGTDMLNLGIYILIGLVIALLITR